jgi:hypothetical protein
MSKRNPEPNRIKSAKTLGAFSLFAETIAGAAQKVFRMVMRMTIKEKDGATQSKKFPTGINDGVPAYTWSLGCSAGAEGMIAAYNDRLDPNLIDGDMLLDDNAWEAFTDSAGETNPNHPLISSMQGVNDRTMFGTIENYWISYKRNVPDPYTGFETDHNDL